MYSLINVLHKTDLHIDCELKQIQQLIRKIWGLHGDDYEEYRLLGYRNPVRTSQETHLSLCYRAQAVNIT
jgi:hypothetical protein